MRPHTRPKTSFDRLYLDCEIPSMPFLHRPFEEMAAPNWPSPHPAFKGRDCNGARFVYCRRPVRVECDDGAVTSGILPIIVFQRRFRDEVGFMVVFPNPTPTLDKNFVTQVCEDVKVFLPDLTNAMVGDPLMIATTGAQVFVNPMADDVDAQEQEGAAGDTK
jgi:hypothetical protein